MEIAGCKLEIVICDLEIVGCNVEIVSCVLEIDGCKLEIARCKAEIGIRGAGNASVRNFFSIILDLFEMKIGSAVSSFPEIDFAVDIVAIPFDFARQAF